MCIKTQKITTGDISALASKNWIIKMVYWYHFDLVTKIRAEILIMMSLVLYRCIMSPETHNVTPYSWVASCHPRHIMSLLTHGWHHNACHSLLMGGITSPVDNHLSTKMVIHHVTTYLCHVIRESLCHSVNNHVNTQMAIIHTTHYSWGSQVTGK